MNNMLSCLLLMLHKNLKNFIEQCLFFLIFFCLISCVKRRGIVIVLFYQNIRVIFFYSIHSLKYFKDSIRSKKK